MDVPAEPYSLLPSRANRLPASCAGEGQGERGSTRPLIDAEHLAFRHADDRPFLYEDLNFAIHHGECIAIRGPSGCGKSTLAKLLQGFYLPTRGAICI
jgi:subfamily B ATP-binding cassette protein HlyB/CyaB